MAIVKKEKEKLGVGLVKQVSEGEWKGGGKASEDDQHKKKLITEWGSHSTLSPSSADNILALIMATELMNEVA